MKRKTQIIIFSFMCLLFIARLSVGYMENQHKVDRWVRQSFMGVGYYTLFAQFGDVESQLKLISIYGLKNKAQGGHDGLFKWATIASLQNEPVAWYKLSSAYRFGIGTEANDTLAKQWALKAAETGHMSAAYALAQMYETDEFVAADYKSALLYFKVADLYGYLIDREYTRVLKQLNKQQIAEVEQSFLKWQFDHK